MAYVNKEKLILDVQRNLIPGTDEHGEVSEGQATRYFLSLINKQPVAYVEKVRHGKWVLDTNYTGKHKEIWVCSVCTHYQSKKISGHHRDNPNKIKFMKYCPNCGARMDGDT